MFWHWTSWKSKDILSHRLQLKKNNGPILKSLLSWPERPTITVTPQEDRDAYCQVIKKLSALTGMFIFGTSIISIFVKFRISVEFDCSKSTIISKIPCCILFLASLKVASWKVEKFVKVEHEYFITDEMHREGVTVIQIPFSRHAYIRANIFGVNKFLDIGDERNYEDYNCTLNLQFKDFYFVQSISSKMICSSFLQLHPLRHSFYTI